MKVVVIGGTGLIGSKVVSKLNEHGYEAVAASPNSGVNTLTGEGLAEVLEGASVVVDVSNSPSFEDAAVMNFFQTSTRNLLAAEAAAGVGHHVALSVVGCDRLPESGYLRAKVAQEKLIRESSIPFSIVRATQFFEFLKRAIIYLTNQGAHAKILTSWRTKTTRRRFNKQSFTSRILITVANTLLLADGPMALSVLHAGAKT
ncbi:MAG TPA: NAD(P)H-binding protein [Pyrinomonadaceae bacterium]|nr:NAD(P)H-binding protein [Pyrinomonadaceae bacterium]